MPSMIMMTMMMMMRRESRAGNCLRAAQRITWRYRSSRRSSGTAVLAMSTARRLHQRLTTERETVFGRADSRTGTGSDVISLVAAVAVCDKCVQ